MVVLLSCLSDVAGGVPYLWRAGGHLRTVHAPHHLTHLHLLNPARKIQLSGEKNRDSVLLLFINLERNKPVGPETSEESEELEKTKE